MNSLAHARLTTLCSSRAPLAGPREVMTKRGQVQKDSFVLTDSAILSKKKESGLTDLGAAGIASFMYNHRCTHYCLPHRCVGSRRCPAQLLSCRAGVVLRGTKSFAKNSVDLSVVFIID